MSKGRLEAFSDGVIAIIITIMVLELKAPHGGAVDGRHGLPPAPAGNHPGARAGLNIEEGNWARLEGQAIAMAVCDSDCYYAAFSIARPGDSCCRRADLADSGPAY